MYSTERFYWQRVSYDLFRCILFTSLGRKINRIQGLRLQLKFAPGMQCILELCRIFLDL
jgi:hypothetical protein